MWHDECEARQINSKAGPQCSLSDAGLGKLTCQWPGSNSSVRVVCIDETKPNHQKIIT